MISKLTVLVFIVCGFALNGLAQERYVRPFDEGDRDASFSAFRKKLVAAVEKKDMRYVLSIVDKGIKNGFGGNDGIAEFKKQWKTGTDFWKYFLPVIKNGGRFDGDDASKRNSFTAPYLFNDFPNDLDPFEYAAVFGTDVNLRETPDLNGKIVAKLSYNVLKVDYNGSKRLSRDSDDSTWMKVESLGGLKGWMSAPYVRSSVDYRAGFEKIRGVWKLTFFLAGD